MDIPFSFCVDSSKLFQKRCHLKNFSKYLHVSDVLAKFRLNFVKSSFVDLMFSAFP